MGTGGLDVHTAHLSRASLANLAHSGCNHPNLLYPKEARCFPVTGEWIKARIVSSPQTLFQSLAFPSGDLGWPVSSF